MESDEAESMTTMSKEKKSTCLYQAKWKYFNAKSNGNL